MALTDTKLQSLLGKARKSTTELSDRDGLVAAIGKSGKVSWMFRYRFEGKSRRYTFGSYPAFNLSEARARAVKCRRALEEGDDPKHVMESGYKAVTIEQCCNEWLDLYVSGLAKKTQALYASNASKYFSNSRFPYDVQKARFENWITYFDQIATDSSKHNAGHILKTAKSMFRWCKRRRFISDSVLFDIELKAVGERSVVGQRTLEMNEVAKLWIEVTRSKATPSIKACIKLLLLFGARNAEVREAPRSEFDLEHLMWTIPSERSKTKKIIRRPISRTARDLILELDMIYGGSNYLIPGAHLKKCMTPHSLDRFCKRMWGRLHTAYKTDVFTPHDFRRTISTRLSANGVLPHVTEKMLGHELQGIMIIYNKHDWVDDQREAYALWCDLIDKAVKAELSRT